MIPACFARMRQRCIGRLYTYLRLIFPWVRKMRKTRNQLNRSAGCADAPRQTGGHCGAAGGAALCPGGPCAPSRAGRQAQGSNATPRPTRLLPIGALGGRRCRRPWLPPGRVFLRAGGVTGTGGGTACVAPIPCLPVASHGRITAGFVGLNESIAAESDRPPVCTIPAVAGTVDEEPVARRGDALPDGGRPSRLGRLLQPGDARGALRLEPGAPRVLRAVEPPGHLRDTPALRIQEDVVTALGEVWPSTTGLF